MPPNVPPDKVYCYDTNRDKLGQQGTVTTRKEKAHGVFWYTVGLWDMR